MPTPSSRRSLLETSRIHLFPCFRKSLHPGYSTQCEKFTPWLKAAYENQAFSHPRILAACEPSSKMSFLGRDESNFSQEKVLMKSLSTPSLIHIMMTKIMGNIIPPKV
jgi:hypothetical protein